LINALFFGGAFNPPTIAHIQLAKYAMEQINFDRVIFCPTKSKYILNTERKDFSFDEDTRLKMLNDVSKNNSFMIVSDIEIKEKEQSRTYFTLKKLKNEGYNLKLLIGSDWLNKLATDWMYVEEIAKEFGIVILKRNNDDVEELFNTIPLLIKIKKYVIIINSPTNFKFISSNNIRTLLKDYDLNIDKINADLPPELHNLKKYIKGDSYEK